MPRDFSTQPKGLKELSDAKHQFGRAAAAKTAEMLVAAKSLKFTDPKSLLDFHDTLLFLRAFPQSARIVEQSEALLRSIEAQVRQLQAIGVDLSLFDTEEFSGVAGTELRNAWTFELARWLEHRHPGDV